MWSRLMCSKVALIRQITLSAFKPLHVSSDLFRSLPVSSSRQNSVCCSRERARRLPSGKLLTKKFLGFSFATALSRFLSLSLGDQCVITVYLSSNLFTFCSQNVIVLIFLRLLAIGRFVG